MILKAITKYGTVAGCEDNGSANFRGIPFAKAPLGDLRFMPPVEPDSWEGERDCTSFAPGCITARKRGDLKTSEDCLYLNVWTAAEDSSEKRPVMVWIYGGGFQDGNGADPMFNGSALSKKGVVTVTFNYRGGALGFFTLPELDKRTPSGTSGNFGLLDQIAALKWVRENISAFGGDPDNVLIHGQSAGGISCRMLLTSPLAKGLFNKVVVQSGGGLNEADPVRPMAELADIGRRAMEYAGWTVEDILTRDAEEVNSVLCNAAVEVLQIHVPGIFQPCLDGYVVDEVPGVKIKNGDYDDNIDIICGTVSGDSWMFCRQVASSFGRDDSIFRPFSYSPGVAWADWQVKTGRKPIHTYYMERTQPKRQGGPGGPGGPGRGNDIYRYGQNCPHTSEIPYVFGTLNARSDQFDNLDREISELLMDYWTNFAKTGDPDGPGLPEWPLYTKDTPIALHISDDGVAFDSLVNDKMAEKVIEFVQDKPGMLEDLEGWE